MNRLSRERRCAVVRCLVDGVSARATSRLTGVARATVLRLLVDLGFVCGDYLDRILRDLPCRRIQADEIWSFCHTKRKNLRPEQVGQFGYGDVWTWVAMDPDTKLVVTWLIGGRGASAANQFMADLATRLAHRIQLSTDGYEPYIDAVYGAFGSEIDYAMVVKDFTSGTARWRPVCGDPHPDHVSTSLIERQNLTLRMELRRYTRRTNGHSKKIENHAYAVALYAVHYNFIRPHTTLSGQTPAQAAGLAAQRLTMRQLVKEIDARAPKPKRGPYRKRAKV